jgi:hypothetical protein
MCNPVTAWTRFMGPCIQCSMNGGFNRLVLAD